MRHLHLDPVGGIAGDMFLAALVDLGCPLEVIREGLRHLKTQQPWKLSAKRVERHAIGAVHLTVAVGGEGLVAHAHDDDHGHDHHCGQDAHRHDHAHAHDHGHGHSHSHAHGHSHDHAHGHSHAHPHAHDHAHHHTSAKDVFEMAASLPGPSRVRDRATAIVRVLAEAEARVHGKPVEEVHFHEVGAVDSIVDMLGAAIALEYLGIDKLSCGPLPVGSGFVKCQHGMMPLPAPATAYLLEGCPTRGIDFDKETVTPTGAAIVKALCSSFGAAPEMELTGTGYGAGTRDDVRVPNLLRVMRGER